MDDPRLEQGKNARSALRRKEGQSQGEMSWPQPPLSITLHHQGGEREETGTEAEPGKKAFLRFCFVSAHLPHHPRKPITLDGQRAQHLLQKEKAQETGDGT